MLGRGQAHQQLVVLYAQTHLAVDHENMAAEHGFLHHIHLILQRGAHGIDQVQGTISEPVDPLRDPEVVSARNFTLFQAVYADAMLQSSFQICLKRWTDDNLIDWGMVSYCAQDQLDGFDSLAPLQSKSRN